MALQVREEGAADPRVAAVAGDEEAARGGRAVVEGYGYGVFGCGVGGEGFVPLAGGFGRLACCREREDRLVWGLGAVCLCGRVHGAGLRLRWGGMIRDRTYLDINVCGEDPPQPPPGNPNPLRVRRLGRRGLQLPRTKIVKRKPGTLAPRHRPAVHVRLGKPLAQLGGDSGAQGRERPVQRQAPSDAPGGQAPVALKDAEGDGALAEVLGEDEAAYASADDEDGGAWGCHFAGCCAGGGGGGKAVWEEGKCKRCVRRLDNLFAGEGVIAALCHGTCILRGHVCCIPSQNRTRA